MLLRPSTDMCPKELARDTRGFFNSLLGVEILESLVDEFGDSGGDGKALRGVPRRWTHLAPCFPDNFQELLAGIVRMLRRKRPDFVFQEDETSGIFQKLRIRIRLEADLGNPGGDIIGFPFVHACLEQKLARTVRLFPVKVSSPGQISGPALGIRGPGGCPALKVLAARGQA